MSKSKKLPALQFYPGDWRKSMDVQSLSFHDRGVWFEMLMLMHDSERRGVLVLNGMAMSDEMIARCIGLDNQNFNQTLTTLLISGVACREQGSGAVMSRRMVRDENLRIVRTEAGKLGGNPDLVNQNQTTEDKQKPTPSSSVSTTKPVNSHPRPDNEDVSSVIIQTIIAHPRSRLVSLTEIDVRPRDTVATLQAIDAEVASVGISRTMAAEMIRDRTIAIAEGVPREEWKFIKPVDEFMRDRHYRLEPSDLTRKETNAENRRNRAERVSPAIQRQRESDEGLRNIAARRYGVSSLDEADEGSVYQSAASGGDRRDVPSGVGRDGPEVRDAGVHGSVIEGHPG